MKIATFDIETRDWVYPIGTGFYDGKDYELFEGDNQIEKILKFLDEKYNKSYSDKVFIYAHYGGKFDFIFLLEYMLKNNLKIEIKPIKEKILSIKWGKIEFRDSFFLLPTGLKKLCESFGYKKLDVNVEEFTDKLDSQGKEYLKMDCINLYNILQDFRKMEDIDYIPYTLPALALNTFLKMEGIQKKDIRLSNEKNDFCFKGYYASRNEILRMRADNVFTYDVNSLFPYSMLNEFPDFINDKGIFIDKPKNNILEKYEGLAECSVKIFDNYIPSLPYRREDRKIIFPVGEWNGHYTFPLLRYITENNLGSVKIEKALVFKNTRRFFESYIEKYYGMKQKGGAYYTIGKMFTTNLYGKFAEGLERTHLLLNPKSITKILRLRATLISPKLDVWQYKKVESFLPHRNVLISAYITSYAMIYLHKNMLKNEDKIIYTDTDSLHLFGKGDLNVGKKIGQWKFEGLYDEGMYVLPKLYFLRNKNKYFTKAKGFTRKFQPKSFHDMTEKKYKRFPTFKMFLLKGNIRLHTEKKSIKSTYDKRLVDGDLTKPITIGVR